VIKKITILFLIFISASSLLCASRMQHEKNEKDKNMTFIFSSTSKNVIPTKNHMQTGRDYFLNNEYQSAVNTFSKEIHKNPKNSSAWNNLGLSLNKLDQYYRASEMFFAAYKITAKNSYLYNASRSLLLAGEIHKSLKSCHHLLSIDEQNHNAWKLLGKGYEHLSQFKEAKNAYLKAIAIAPNDAQAIYHLENLEHISTPKMNLVAMKIDVPTKQTNIVNHEDFSGILPKSRILTYQLMDIKLRSLLESYDLTKDAPNKMGLKATNPDDIEVYKSPVRPKVILKSLKIDSMDDL
jgi:tetratricopeptide (TPR) repeat protein